MEVFVNSHTLQSALESGQEAKIVQIDLVQPLIVSTIKAFSIRSSLLVLEVLCYRYWQSLYQTDHSTLWRMVVGVNWLTLCQDCRREVFLAHYCSSCTLRRFFPFGKINWSVMLMTPLWWPSSKWDSLCLPQVFELQLQSSWSVTLAMLVSGVSFGGLNLMQVRSRLW